jgi:hypothetical protein
MSSSAAAAAAWTCCTNGDVTLPSLRFIPARRNLNSKLPSQSYYDLTFFGINNKIFPLSWALHPAVSGGGERFEH